MSDRDYELIGLIQDIIQEEIKYYGSMIGQVVSTDDELLQGRIQVTIPALGIDTQESALWVSSRDKHSVSVPIVGDWVEIRFMDGHRDRAYYCGICNQIASQKLKNFDGQRTTHILFENPNESAEFIKYDEVQKELDILINIIKLQGGTEAFVLGNQLNTFLTNLVTWLNAHVHTSAAPGNPTTAPTVPTTNPAGILSTTITGK
jgi:hypothetical protein